MKTNLSYSPTDLSILIMRIALGGVIFAHGAQKLFGWFGGFGFDATMAYFTDHLALPWIIGFLVILGESVGAVALIAGFFGRMMSLSLLIIIMGAMYLDHAPNGFFMNWFGNRPGGEGIEFDLLVFGLAIPLALTGSGRYSLDALVFRSVARKSVT